MAVALKVTQITQRYKINSCLRPIYTGYRPKIPEQVLASDE